jgi:hypothetical protein
MKTRIIVNGSVLGWLAKDLANLRADPDVRFDLRPLDWHPMPAGAPPLYRPPGVWGWYLRRVNTLAVFPPPHHPLEMAAAARGWCGQDVEAVNRWRCEPWVNYLDRLAKVLFVSRVQIRLLYHVLTPLYTNGAPDGLAESVASVREYLYAALGFRDPGVDWWVAKAARSGGAAAPPCRMDFWGGEVYGEVML